MAAIDLFLWPHRVDRNAHLRHRVLSAAGTKSYLFSVCSCFRASYWKSAFFFTQAWVYRLAVLVGYLIVLAVAAVLFSSFQQKFLQGLISWRNRIGWLRWIVIAAALCGPVLFCGLAGMKIYLTNPNIRFSFLLIELFLVAFLLNKNEVH